MWRSTRRSAVPLAAILGVGLLLRLVALRTRGIWYDDAFSLFLARRDVASIVAGTAADTMPPLYYFLLHLWMVLGQDLALLRALNVLVSLTIVALTHRLALVLFGPRAAAVAALLAAVSPFQIYHAQELRMYGLLCLNLLLHLYFLARLYLQRDRRRWVSWLGLVTSGALAMYSHNLAIFTLLGANLLLLLERRWSLLGRLLLAQLLILLLAAPWLTTVPEQVAKIQRAFWTPRPGLLELVQLLLTFHTNLPVPRWMLPGALATAVLFLALVTFEVVRRRRRMPGVHLLAAMGVFPPALLALVSYLMRPLFVPRGVILSSVVYYVLAALAGAASRRRLVRAALVLTFVVPALAALPAQYTVRTFPRSPFESAVAVVRARLEDGDVVLHDNKLSFFPSHYYGPDLAQRFLADEPGSHNDTLARATQDAMAIWPAENLRAATGDASRVWFVFFQRAAEEYAAAGFPDHPVKVALEQEWRQVDRVVLSDLEVVLYEHR